MAQSPKPFELFAAGRYTEALDHLHVTMSSRELDVSEQVLHAELLCAHGEHELAMTLAHKLLKLQDLTAIQRCRLRFTLGQGYFDKGDSAAGTEHFRSGAELAARCGNLVEECRLRQQLFRNEIRWLGLQHAGAGLDALRRKIHQAGNPSISLLFQIDLTELAARLSLLSRARRHLETARALLPQVANRAFHTQFRHTEVALTVEEGDSAEALRLALALVADERSGASANLVGNIGHLFLMQSQFDQAEQWLQRSVEMAKAGGREIGILDTLMYLRLLQGDLADAGALDQTIERMLNGNEGLRDSTFALWHVTTHVRWLYELGHFREGMSALQEAMPRIARMGDRRLLARTKLLHAEGLGRSGLAAEGVTLVAEVLDTKPQPPMEILAEASRVVGGLLVAEEPAVALAYYNRAEQTFESLGHKAMTDAVKAERQRSLAADPLLPVLDTRTASHWSERIAAILSVGGHPLLLAAQTQALIADAGAALDLRLVEIEPEMSTKRATIMCIPVGVHRSKHLALRVELAHTTTSRATLLAISRIVRNSLDLATARASEREQTIWPAQPAEHPLGLICTSEQMLELVQTIRRVANSDASVLLTGETGVGKELFAKALHEASQRSDRIFLPFNCSTVSREMIDSQLFGHRRGSFTGAVGDSAGVIRAAAGGTLFLDEIGELSIDTQPKLLRFLESGEILPLGETKPQIVDVRVVAATNANLDQLVADGRFREDLYYRLNVIRINIPPLRERREEIPALVEHFLERFGRELQKPLLRVADETLEYLVLYRWPGNVRQLANEIRRLVAMAEPGGIIMPAHLSNDIAESRRTLPANRSPRLFDEVVTRIDQPLSAAVEHIERAAIQRALAMTDGHLDEAARVLGLSRKGLYLKRQRLNIG
jgi:transcriptional regulator with PAS, ATPase and Fis domain